MTPHRILFWQIQPVWLFYLLAAMAVGVFFFGLISHVRIWARGVRRQSIPFLWNNLSNIFLDGFLGRRIFKGDIAAGTMHLFVLWGFLGLFAGTVLMTVDNWIYSFIKGPIYILYSICLEILGLMLMIGLIWALVRRYIQRVQRLERRIEDFAIVVWLFAATISGFFVEGFRLAAQRPEWANVSFVGHWVSLLWPNPHDALSLYISLWWAHAILSLGLIAAIPFCKLFHVLAAPVSIYLKDQPLQVVPIETRDQEKEAFSYRDIISFDACTRCGRCVEICPSAGAGEPFAPRDFILSIKGQVFLRISDRTEKTQGQENVLEPQMMWYCTTCLACLEVCPVYVATPDAVRQVRSKVVEEGTQVPPLLTQTLEKLYKYNNPWEASKKKKANWSQDLEIQDLTRTEEPDHLCYFVGCTTALDTRAQELALSFARIMEHAKNPFGTLGKKEPCCGDIARRVGEDGLFEEQMEDCLDLFQRYGIRDVVTSSPHCFHTFLNEYTAFQALKALDEQVHFRVRHYSQVLSELIKAGSVRFEKPFHVKITYHDPCYLGRHNQVFDAPREVITAIPGVQLVEMAHNRADSLCCGGGGGRMWQEGLDADIKMSEIRVQEAEATGAEIVVTACPLCLIMLEDARKTAGVEDSLRVMDLNELVVMALGLQSEE